MYSKVNEIMPGQQRQAFRVSDFGMIFHKSFNLGKPRGKATSVDSF